MKDYIADARLRLLSQIPGDLVALDESKALLSGASRISSNEEEPHATASVEPYTEIQFLEEQGVDTGSQRNLELRNAREAVQGHTTMFRGRKVDKESVRPMIRELTVLYRLLLRGDADPEQAEFGWDTLMQGCESLALTPDLSPSQVAFTSNAIDGAQRAPRSGSDSNFDEHGSWGGPAHEVPAAVAAMYLFSLHPSSATRRLVAAASSDLFTPARGQVAQLLLRAQSDKPLMWQIAEAFAQRDSSPAVVGMFVNASLGYLFHDNAAKANTLLASAYSRAKRSRWANVRGACDALYLWRKLLGELAGERAVREVIAGRKKDPVRVQALLFQLRSHLRNAQLQKAAIVLTAKLANTFVCDFEDIVQANMAVPDSVQEAVGKNVLELSSELYFALGAFQLRQNSSAKPANEDLALFDELTAVYAELSKVGTPAVVHHALETLEFFLNSRPAAVFDLATAFIESGSKFGFQYELMGAQLAVRLMETFAGEHRPIIESSRSRREAFVRVLNAFSLWPEAVRLIYRFDEIFR